MLNGQGESAFPDKVLTGSMGIAVDNKPPVIRVAASLAGNVLTARVHDRIGPSHTHDFTKVVVVAGTTEIPMTWYGEMLWRASIPVEAMSATYQVCATDRQGNMACASNVPPVDDAGVGGDAGDTNPPGKSGGCCETGTDQRGAALIVALTALGMRRRRARSR